MGRKVRPGCVNVMKKPKAGMVTTLICDRMWGRYTCNWFCRQFPAMRGRTLEFRSDKAVEIDPAMFEWLTVNGYL